MGRVTIGWPLPQSRYKTYFVDDLHYLAYSLWSMFRKVLFLSLIVLLPMMSACQQLAPPSNSVDGESFVVGDSEGSAELRFKMGKEEEVLTYVCAADYGEGGIEQLTTL